MFKTILLPTKNKEGVSGILLDCLVLLLYLTVFVSLCSLRYSLICHCNFDEGRRKLFSKEEKSMMNRRIPDVAIATSVSISYPLPLLFVRNNSSVMLCKSGYDIDGKSMLV